MIVDPPATGLGSDVREILRRNPAATFFMSPVIRRLWPATWPILARPIKLESVTPFDMFPQTAEIEVLAHL